MLPVGLYWLWFSITSAGIDYIRYYPAVLLLRSALTDDAEAISEFTRRVDTGRFSRSSASRLAKLVISKYEQGPPNESERCWGRLLDALLSRALLSKDQVDRIFSILARSSMKVRPGIRSGDPLVVQVSYGAQQWFPLGEYRFWHDAKSMVIQGRSVYDVQGFAWRERPPDWDLSSWGAMGKKTLVFRDDTLGSGRFDVRYNGQTTVMRPEGDPRRDEASWVGNIDLTAKVDIVARDAPHPVRSIEGPGLSDKVKGRFHVWTAMGPLLVEGLDAENDLFRCAVYPRGPVPVPVAFDVFLRVGGRELRAEILGLKGYEGNSGRRILAWGKGETDGYEFLARVPVVQGEQVSVILRSSRDAALRTIDLFAVWEGELQFGPYRL